MAEYSANRFSANARARPACRREETQSLIEIQARVLESPIASTCLMAHGMTVVNTFSANYRPMSALPCGHRYDSVDIWHRLCLPLRHVVLRLGLSVAVQLIELGLRLLLVD